MADQQELFDLNEVPENLVTEENISKDEAKGAADISRKIFSGLSVCTVGTVSGTQRDFNNYSCIGIVLGMTVDSIIEAAMPVFSNGKPVLKNGEAVTKVRSLTDAEKKELSATYAGAKITDTINLFNENEKPAMRDRRLNIALAFGLIGENGGNLSTRDWLKVQGKKIVVKTEVESYTPDGKDEPVKFMKVAWDGFSRVTEAVKNSSAPDYGSI